MQIVDVAYLAPAQCAFTKSATGPFIDLGIEFDLDHAGRVYIKASYARELGAFAGLPSVDELESAQAEAAELRERVAELEQQVGELSEFNAAAKYTVEKMGERVRRRPGPKVNAASAA